jgi:hypothetical protein
MQNESDRANVAEPHEGEQHMVSAADTATSLSSKQQAFQPVRVADRTKGSRAVFELDARVGQSVVECIEL